MNYLQFGGKLSTLPAFSFEVGIEFSQNTRRDLVTHARSLVLFTRCCCHRPIQNDDNGSAHCGGSGGGSLPNNPKLE